MVRVDGYGMAYLTQVRRISRAVTIAVAIGPVNMIIILLCPLVDAAQLFLAFAVMTHHALGINGRSQHRCYRQCWLKVAHITIRRGRDNQYLSSCIRVFLCFAQRFRIEMGEQLILHKTGKQGFLLGFIQAGHKGQSLCLGFHFML